MQKIYQRINWENDPSTNTPLNEDNLNKMDYALDQIDDRVVNLSGYEGRVAQSEENAKIYAANAKTSENNAKTSADNAKQSETKAKEYMENAFNTTPEGYAQVVEKVEMMDIKTSTDNTLYNSKKGGYRLNEMVGNTEQKQLSGKNKLYYLKPDNTTKNGIAITYNEDGSITLNGTCTAWFFVNLNRVENQRNIPNGSYIFNGGGSSSAFVTWFVGDRKYYSYGNSIVELTDSDVSDFVRLEVVNGAVLSNVTIRPMIRDASIADDTYEPYCGGTPSPNPEFPQAIENTFDCVEMIAGGYDYSNGNYVPSTTISCSKHKVSCKAGDTIKVEVEETSDLFIMYYNKNSYVSYTNKGSATSITVTVPSGVDSFNIRVGKPIADLGKVTLKVNEKHVGQFVESDVKNLFDYSSHVANGNVSQFEVVGGKTLYRNSQINLRDNWVVYDVYDNPLGTFKTYQGATLEDGSIEVILPTNAKYIRTTDTSGVSAKLEILYIGYDLLSKYENRTEKVTTFYLNEPLRATDKMFRENVLVKVERNRYSLVLNGTETFSNDGVHNGLYVYALSIESLSIGTMNISKGFLCTHYPTFIKYYSNCSEVGVYYGASMFDTNWLEFATNFATVAEFKAYLAEQYSNGTPIKLEFSTRNPRYETLDTESQIAINDMVTFDGVTNIEVDSKVKPSGISGEYGTSQVSARTLKNELRNDNLEIKYNELAVALVSL